MNKSGLNFCTIQHSQKGVWSFSSHESVTLCEKCPSTEFFLVRVFPRSRISHIRISPYSVRMRENTDQKKLRIWTLFTQCKILWLFSDLPWKLMNFPVFPWSHLKFSDFSDWVESLWTFSVNISEEMYWRSPR